MLHIKDRRHARITFYNKMHSDPSHLQRKETLGDLHTPLCLSFFNIYPVRLVAHILGKRCNTCGIFASYQVEVEGVKAICPAASRLGEHF